MPKLRLEDLIIFENPDYILINKPPFISTLDERTQDRTTSIIGLIRKYNPDLQICHRLDKETSGVMAIAKHFEAYRHLSIQFQKRQVTKIYHTISHGSHDFNQEEIKMPILKLSKKGLVTLSREEGKPAFTTFTTLEHFGNYTFIEARPHTGRMHQIRIHLVYLRAPIVGDVAYGGRWLYLSELKNKKFHLKKDTQELPIMQRVALHAHSLTFKGMQGETISQQSTYPKDFAVLLKQLEKWG